MAWAPPTENSPTQGAQGACGEGFGWQGCKAADDSLCGVTPARIPPRAISPYTCQVVLREGWGLERSWWDSVGTPGSPSTQGHLGLPPNAAVSFSVWATHWAMHSPGIP